MFGSYNHCFRFQSVSIHRNTAEPAPISLGVPQGSVLGPVHSIVYTASLSTVIKKHSVLYHSYAYHWRELPQISFFSCVRRYLHNFFATKDVSYMFVATKLLTKLCLSRQAYFCSDRRRVLSRQTRVCREKKGDICGSSRQ